MRAGSGPSRPRRSSPGPGHGRVEDWDYRSARIRWFEGGRLNVAYNCLDRHLATRGDQTATLWEGDEPGETRSLTYRELYESVCRCANALQAPGVTKGDRVAIYMPMVPEAVAAMLACARISAIHPVVFGGFSPESLDSDWRVVVTADEGLRGGRHVPLKANVDAALGDCPFGQARDEWVRRDHHPWQHADGGRASQFLHHGLTVPAIH